MGWLPKKQALGKINILQLMDSPDYKEEQNVIC